MHSKQTKLFTPKDIDEKVLIYNIRIVPPKPLFDQVISIKEEFVEHFGEHLLSNSDPFITVAKFKMSALHHNYLMDTFKNHLSELSPFHLMADGIGKFENGSTLCVNIRESKKFEALLKQIGGLKRALLFHKAKNFSLNHRPIIPISSFLDKNLLDSSFNHFKNKIVFQTIFEVDHLLITSRENGKTWDWEHRIDLKK